MIESNHTYMMVLDENQSDIVLGLINLAEDEGAQFFKFLAQKNLMGTYDDFVKDFLTKRHDKKWCKDPECNWDEENIELAP